MSIFDRISIGEDVIEGRKAIKRVNTLRDTIAFQAKEHMKARKELINLRCKVTSLEESLSAKKMAEFTGEYISDSKKGVNITEDDLAYIISIRNDSDLLEEFRGELWDKVKYYDHDVTGDLSHYLELNDLSDTERAKCATAISNVRRLRRQCKDAGALAKFIIDRRVGYAPESFVTNWVERKRGRTYAPKACGSLSELVKEFS